jgi:NADH-quinone oxidoreductase subunit N
LWLVVIALGMSALSLYYYLQVLKQIYVVEPPREPLPIQAGIPTLVVIVLLAALTVLLGCAPTLLLNELNVALRSSGW